MSYLPVLAMLDRKIADTASVANRAANMLNNDEFDSLNMGTGVAVRLQVLNEVRADVVRLGLEKHALNPPSRYSLIGGVSENFHPEDH